MFAIVTGVLGGWYGKSEEIASKLLAGTVAEPVEFEAIN